MKKRLITEADVGRLAPGTTVELDGATLVTPAARDLAFVRNITWRSPGTAARGAAKSCCDACARGEPCRGGASVVLGEGDWLVEVRGGVARARRVEGGGGGASGGGPGCGGAAH